MALQAVSMKELKLELLLEPERAGDTVPLPPKGSGRIVQVL